MPKFGAASLAQRATLHPDLQTIADGTVAIIDITIVEGHRGEVAQNQAYDKGFSKVRWPHGKHNKKPSHAMDIAPYPIDWSNRAAAIQRFVYMQGVVKAVAHKLGIKIRQGMDWDGDLDLVEERFRDYPHVELVNPRPVAVARKARRGRRRK